ncbi:8504_t:CDS:2 [Entrophospora sp. SA101]|nr:8504_t:CDS:2 [Entrophospora sp. SA101]CAJ0860617.1 4557_t:CDS:2 [Entrophospora sp. SA101]
MEAEIMFSAIGDISMIYLKECTKQAGFVDSNGDEFSGEHGNVLFQD